MADFIARLQSALGAAYRVDAELGGGGMSRVFAAEEIRLGRQVVVKVLPPELAASVSAERFEREIQLAAKLQHPHIVPLLTAGSAGDLLYYIMPRVEGRSLRARLAQEHELPVGEAVRILRDVCDALAYAHAHGIVHRDIKPDNVLLSGKHALVTDFGVAKAVATSSAGTALTSRGVAIGTPEYMAPEQAAGDPGVDHRADLYAVGALGYELLAGRPPFSGTAAQAVLAAQITATPEPVTRHRATVPPVLGALIMRCLAKHPADRVQTAEELVGQLEAVLPAGATTPDAALISSGTAAAIRRGHPIRVATLFAFAALGVLTLVYMLVRLLGLPDWAFAAALGLAAAGLPIMVWTGVVERRRALASGTGGAALPLPAGVHRWFTWRRALLGGAAAFGLLGVGTGVYMAMRLLGIGPVGTLVASGVLAERDRLVLADFENRSTDSTLGLSVGEALRIDLAQSRVVRLIDGAAVAAALRRMNQPPDTRLTLALARELAEREGAKAVVRGQIDPVGRGYVLAAELIAPADGTVLVALRETAKDDGAIVDAVDRLSKRLRERIGESLRTIRASEPLEQVTTGSLEALRKYSQGMRAADAGQLERAVARLNEAIALDTTFAMAYRKLAVVLTNSTAARSRVAAAATKAFRHRDRLTPLERALAEANYYSAAEVDADKEEQAYRAALEIDPENGIALNNLALALNRRRRFAEAESLAVHGIAVTPSLPTLYVQASGAQIGQGKFAAAAATLDLFGQRAPGNPLVLLARGRLAVARGDFDGAAADMRQLGEARDLLWQARSAGTLAMLSLVRGKVAQAQGYARRAADLNAQRGVLTAEFDQVLTSALVDLRYHNAAVRARRTVDDLLRRRPLSSIPAEDRPYLGLAWFEAEAGRVEHARQLLNEYTAAVPEATRRAEPFRHGAAAAIAFAEGRVQDAIDGYRAWSDADDCAACGLYYLAQAYERAGQRDSALAVYERSVTTPRLTTTPGRLLRFQEAATLAPTYKRLGELYEAGGQLDKARDYYGRFVDLWTDADPELQPLVRDVRQRLVKLRAEPR